VVLDTTSGGRDALHVGAVRLFAVSGDGSPLRAPRPPLLAALDVLHDTLDDDAGGHHLATIGGRFLAT
jgi:hypothetical protein